MGSKNGNPFSPENLERALHPPGPDTPEKGLLRQEFATLFVIMRDHVPECAERTLAMRKLQEAMHWSYTAIDKGGHPCVGS